MPLTRKDKDFAVPLVSVLDAKTIDLERALVNFLIKLKYGPTPTVRSSPRLLTVRELTDIACSRVKSGQLRGFAEHEDVVYRWLESDILDLVNRGNPIKENLASARPLHLNAFRLRNPKHCNDYGASTAIYNLLVWEAEDVLKSLLAFFGEGLEPETERYDGQTPLDIETTLLLRLADDAPREQRDLKKKPVQAFPLCIAHARVLADDLRRILAYKDQVPRSVMIDYLKNVIGLHLGLYTLRLFHVLPALVELGTYPDACAGCHENATAGAECAACPLRPAILVDLGDSHRTRMAELARRSVRGEFAELSRYIKAHLTVRKLWEYAAYLQDNGALQHLPGSVPDLIALRGRPDDLTFNTFFSTRISNLIETNDDEEPDSRLQEIRRLGLPPMETYIEMLYLLRQRFHTRYYTQLLDSMLQKNQESALLRQGRGPINQRRFTIGSGMLETLAQIAVLKPARAGFESQPMLVDDFLDFLRQRYGILIGSLPDGDEVPPADLAAVRENVAEFKRRLREIGFYTDLSDAYIAQTIRPRYQVEGTSMIDASVPQLRHVSVAGLYERLGDCVAPGLVALVRERSAGHCMRIDDLPEYVARGLAERIAAETDAEVYVLSEADPGGVGITATKLVARRNSEEKAKVLVFVPPGTRTAAEDSFGTSTFESIPLGGSIRQLRDDLRQDVLAQANDATRVVLDQVVRHVTSLGAADDVAFARYYATLIESGPGMSTAGLALYQLGLLPDGDLLAQGDDLLPRLARNRELAELFSRPDRTVFEKLQAARLNPHDPRTATFRRETYDFFAGLRSLDRFDWTRRIALEPTLAGLAFDRWPLVEAATDEKPEIVVHSFKLKRNDDGYPRLVLAETTDLPVSWETTPPPIHCQNLAMFAIELYQGDSPVTEARIVKRGTAVSARRSTKLKDLHRRNLEEGLHVVRVTAYSEDGDLLAYEDSEPVFVELEKGSTDDEGTDESSPRIEPVTSLYHVELLRRLAAKKGDRLGERGAPTGTWSNAGQTATANRVDTYVLRFSSREAYGIPVNAFLHRVEEQILAEPDDLGLYTVDLARVPHEERDAVELQPFDHIEYDGLEDFLAARRALFAAIREGTPDDERPVVATTDLRPLRDLVLAYAAAYRSAVEALGRGEDPQARTRANAQLLAIDTLDVRTRRGARAVLMAPTHPLKLLWTYQYAQVLDTWGEQLAELEAEEVSLASVRRALAALTSLNLPAFLVDADGRALTNLDQFDFSWSLFVPPSVGDPRALISEVRSAFGARRGDAALTTIGSDQLAARLRHYLSQHPYVTSLVLNVVQPGSGAILVDTLLRLQAMLRQAAFAAAGPEMRFRVRLLARDAVFDELGAALDDLMHQDVVALGRDAEEIDAFLTASANPLFPKLAFSKHDVEDLLRRPEAFDAHVTLLLDFFEPEVRRETVPPDVRSAYVHGLLHEPVVAFADRDGHAVWQRTVGSLPAPDLPGGAGVADQIAGILAAHQRTAARLLGGDGVPAVRLDLDPVRASVLNQVHQLSDWVVIVDRNFGVEFLDVPQTVGGPAYLIDYAPEGALEGGHRVITSTARVEELRALVRPALDGLGLSSDDAEVDLVLEALKSISGRLVLQLQAARSRPELLGLAFTRLFLRQSGTLSDMFVVPLDAHLSLFAGAASEGAGTSLSRTDLLLVEPIPERRELVLHLVEAKLRGSVAGDFAGSPLRTQIDGQLANTEAVLLSHFGGHSGQGRVDRLLKTKQLATLFGFYLDRARRYGLISPGPATRASEFLRDLEEGYAVRFTRNAVVVDRGGENYERLELDGTMYHLLGKPLLADLLTEPAERSRAPIEEPTSSLLSPTRESFRRWSGRRSADVVVAVTPSPGEAGTGERPPAGEDSAQPSPGAVASAPVETSTEPTRESAAGGPRYDVLLGATHETAQYGILGRANDRTVALDLNGTQTISLFGVQGSGKSYSLGAILEMATRSIPNINRLQQPLASVLFHYSNDQTYRPEFVTMVDPNPASAERELLGREYRAEPAALADVLVLTPEGKLAERRAEFPNLEVQPIFFHPTELSADDWFFLMGAVGNESLYLKKMRQIFRKLRDNVTVNGLLQEIVSLSPQQYDLAKDRITFAREFVSEDRRLADFVRPGRLTIVDVRDPYYERAEVLALFVVMLRALARVEYGGMPFNKLIVFDEAHKYMNDRALIGVVVEAIREMRHKGVSVLIASQDPLSVPVEVIELSSQILLHRFNSPAWLKHVQKAATALGGLNPGRLNMLRSGEAYVWSSKATDDQFTRQAVKLQMRPRVTRHGGETRAAVE